MSDSPPEKPPTLVELIWEHDLVFGGRSGDVHVKLDSASASGPSPIQALAFGLAGCMAMDVVYILRKARLDLKGLKVVVDCAHGAAYKVAPTVLWELGAEVVPLGVAPDGFNINRGLGSSAPAQLAELVRERRADLGIALDGDADRLVLVDEVCYFRADHKYTTVVTAEGEALLRTPIKDLLAVLDPATFKQIHRSTIVNLKAIAGIVRDDSGRGTVRLKHRPETLPVSAPFMALFRHM